MEETDLLPCRKNALGTRMHWVQECIACKVKSVKRGSVKLFEFCNENVFSKTAHEIIYYVLCGYSDALNI